MPVEKGDVMWFIHCRHKIRIIIVFVFVQVLQTTVTLVKLSIYIYIHSILYTLFHGRRSVFGAMFTPLERSTITHHASGRPSVAEQISE